MFLPRKILIANFFVAALVAPVAVHALGVSGATDVPPMARNVPVAQPPAVAAVEKAEQPVAPAASRCNPVRVIYPGPAGVRTACAPPTALR